MTEIEKRHLSLGRWRILIPLGIFVFALAIRLIGIGWGLKNDLHNQSYHPDEEDIFRFSQGVEPSQLKFTPGVYNYGTLYLTTLRVASDMTAVYTGGPDVKNKDSVWSYIARCNLAGRFISAIVGAGTVLLCFLIACRLFGLVGGIASAAILAVAPAHVVHSRFQTVDVMAVFLLCTSVYFALKLLPVESEPSPTSKQIYKWITLSAVFAGLSAGTKYTGILGLLSLITVLYLVRRPTVVKDSLVAIGACFLAFVASCPGILLDNTAFMRDFRYEMLHTSTGHGLVFEGTANGFLFHLANLFQGFGTVATLMGIAALGWACYLRKGWAIALLAFMIPYYILIGCAEVKFIRYTFPLYIGLALGFGAAVAEGRKHSKLGRLAVGAGIVAFGGLDYGGLIGTMRFTGYMTGEDPRDSAARYLKVVAESKPNILVGLPEDPWFWSAPLFKDSTIARRSMSPRKRLQEMQEQAVPHETYYMNPDGSPTQFDKRLITEIKPDFVTYSSLESSDPERFQGRLDVSENAKAIGQNYHDFLGELSKSYEADKSFGDTIPLVQDLAYVQPRVVIWKKKSVP